MSTPELHTPKLDAPAHEAPAYDGPAYGTTELNSPTLDTPAPSQPGEAATHLSRLLADALRYAAVSVAPYLRSVARTVADFDTKADQHDPVTVHDRHTEKLLHALLAYCVPGSRALGEEHGEVTLPSAADALLPTDTEAPVALLGEETDLSAIADLGKRVRWIIDPIDGTANFASGRIYFGTSIAAELDGRIVAGVVTVPMLYEYFYADSQAAFHVDRNGTRTQIHAQGPHEEKQAVLISYYPPTTLKRTNPALAIERELALFDAYMAPRRTGACALDLAYIAAGWTGAMIGTMFKPWDVAAGLHILRTAGGWALNMPLHTELSDGYAPGVVAAGANFHPTTAETIMRAHQADIDAAR